MRGWDCLGSVTKKRKSELRDCVSWSGIQDSYQFVIKDSYRTVDANIPPVEVRTETRRATTPVDLCCDRVMLAGNFAWEGLQVWMTTTGLCELWIDPASNHLSMKDSYGPANRNNISLVEHRAVWKRLARTATIPVDLCCGRAVCVRLFGHCYKQKWQLQDCVSRIDPARYVIIYPWKTHTDR